MAEHPMSFQLSKVTMMAIPVDETLRCSEDSVLNQYGKMLLNLCIAFGLNIMNGVCNGDLQGRYTFISESGNNVNGDYFIVSESLFTLFQHDCQLRVSRRIESDHLTLELYKHFDDLLSRSVQIDKMNLLKNVYGKLTMRSNLLSLCNQMTPKNN